MDAKSPLSTRELRALRLIRHTWVGVDYWEDESIGLYRGLRLIATDGRRINLTVAGLQILLAAPGGHLP
jgi:hypothetical protein